MRLAILHCQIGHIGAYVLNVNLFYCFVKLIIPKRFNRVIYVLDKVYGISRNEIQGMVNDFLAMPGVELVHEIDLVTVFDFWPETISDFGDAIVASLATLYKGSVILTFDLKFIHTLKKLGLAVEKQ